MASVSRHGLVAIIQRTSFLIYQPQPGMKVAFLQAHITTYSTSMCMVNAAYTTAVAAVSHPITMATKTMVAPACVKSEGFGSVSV